MKLKRFFMTALCVLMLTMFIMPGASAAYASEDIYLGGFTLGFDLSGEGALIAGLSEIVSDDGVFLPAKDAGLKIGDIILSLNGKRIYKADDIDEILTNYDGNGIITEVLSDNKKQLKNIYPKKDLSGNYKLGILIRDYLSGLGTVTFINQNGDFFSLGHPITDESGNLLKVSGGNVYECTITGIDKSTRGHAGELKGELIRDKILGTVFANTSTGLTGKFTDKKYYSHLRKMQLGTAKQGSAEIYATISGNVPVKYSIAIVKTDETDKRNKNLVIKITDDRLIDSAGGIVRGMSGSPIVQDGKIVGAITHVFLNDSTRGYGISISKMVSDN